MAETPSSTVTLDHGGPLVFWDRQAAAAGGRHRGLALDTGFCTDPECRWAHLLVTAVVGRGDGEGESLDRDGDVARPQLDVAVDLDTGKHEFFREKKGSNLDPDLEKRVEDLLDKMRKHLLPMLEKRWRHAHGVSRDAWRRKDWSWWDKGTMVSWNEVRPDDPAFLFRSGGEDFLVDDQYCITPGCSCRNVQLNIYRARKRVMPRGHGIRVDLGAWKASDEKRPGRLSRRQKRLWADLNGDAPGLRKELNRRQQEMGRFGPEIVKLSGKLPGPSEKAKDAARTGRNEPCPCGSGRKYKKCCMER